MDDQVLVQVADGCAHLQKQFDFLPRAEFAGELIDRFSFDVFHHQIRLAILTMASVQQTRDVGMRKSRQYLTLHEKALSQRGMVRAGPQELHGYPLRYLAIDTFGQMDGAHAAAAQEVP